MDCTDYNSRLFEHVHGSQQAVSPRMQARITWVADHVPPGVETILEVGAGRGHLSNLLLDRGYHVTSMELIAGSLKTARSRCLQGDGARLPLKDSSVDLVLCVEVIEHLEPDLRSATLREMWRAAARYVLITVPNSENLRESLMRCDRCGHIFHYWGHLASFDADRMSELYPTAPILVQTSGHRQPRYFPPLLTIRQKVFKTYGYDTYSVCPACLNTDIQSPHRSLPVKVLDRLNHWLGLQREAGWLLALYDKGTDL